MEEADLYTNPIFSTQPNRTHDIIDVDQSGRLKMRDMKMRERKIRNKYYNFHIVYRERSANMLSSM